MSDESGLTGLLQQRQCAVACRFCLQGRSRISGDKDGRRGISLGTQALMHLDTRHSGHTNVGNQAGGMSGLSGRKKFLCRLIHAYLPAKRAEEAAQRKTQGSIIVDNRNNTQNFQNAAPALSSQKNAVRRVPRASFNLQISLQPRPVT
jgi:hypothetical protein